MKPWHHLVWSLLALSSCVFTIYWSSRVKCFSRILVNWMMMIGDLFSVIERKALCQQRYEYTMWMYDNTAITSWNCIATHRSRMLETIAKLNDPQTVIFPTICTLFEEIRKKHKLSLVTETLYLNFPDRVVVVADPRFYYYGSALHCSSVYNSSASCSSAAALSSSSPLCTVRIWSDQLQCKYSNK